MQTVDCGSRGTTWARTKKANSAGGQMQDWPNDSGYEESGEVNVFQGETWDWPPTSSRMKALKMLRMRTI